MRMRQVKTLEIAPGETVALKPGGLHLMLIGLKRPLQDGEEISLNLCSGEQCWTYSVPVISVLKE